MPIESDIVSLAVSQTEFGSVAYEVVGHAFAIHEQLGRIFDESVYANTLAHLFATRSVEEARIRLTHGDFEKRYYIDLAVDSGCPFELKVVSQLNDRHRRQLIEYLMLTDLRHGKLINFGGEKLEHEFVNCHETTEHRRSFQIDLSRWPSQSTDARRFQELAVNLLRDWGTGLDRGLYNEAITHFLGGPEIVRQSVETLWNGEVVGRQKVNLVAPGMSYEITSLRTGTDSYEQQLRRFLGNTTLEGIFWVNVVSGRVALLLLSK